MAGESGQAANVAHVVPFFVSEGADDVSGQVISLRRLGG
jgi:hypothetical protein